MCLQQLDRQQSARNNPTRGRVETTLQQVESLHQKYAAKGLTVLGVNPIDQNSASLSDWLQTRKISYNTLFDPDKILPKALGITGYPLLIVADAKTKKVLFVKMGFNEDLESILEPIIVKHLK